MTEFTTDKCRRIEADETGFSVTCTASDTTIEVFLAPAERRQMADALDPGRQGWTLADLARLRTTLANPTTAGAGQWTRDDLPSLPDVLGEVTTHECAEGAAAYRTAALAHLNAHHPKPGHPMDPEAARLRRERDTAFRDADHYRQLRNEQFARAEAAEKRLRQVEARPWGVVLDENKAGHFLPAVTRDEMVKALTEHSRMAFGVPVVSVEEAVEIVAGLVSGDDPAVHVVRESQLDSVQVKRESPRWRTRHAGVTKWITNPEQAVVDARLDLICALAAQRAIEAEQATDPVEAKVTTRHPEHYRLVNEADGSEWRMTRDGSWVAADSVGQEATR